MSMVSKDDKKDVRVFISILIAVALTLQCIGYQLWTLHEETTLVEMSPEPEKGKYGVRW